MRNIFKTLLIAFFVAGRITISMAQTGASNFPSSVPPVLLPTVTSFPYLTDYGTMMYRNFVRTYVPELPTQNTSNISLANQFSFPSVVSTSYFDGLGRGIQDVEYGGVPAKSFVQKPDLVIVHVYDPQGRESTQYLPYSINDSSSNMGKLKTYALDQLSAQYNADYHGDQPYGSVVYDESPLDRVDQSLPPGNSWIGSGKGTTYSYNVYKQSTDHVAYWTVSDVDGAAPVFNGYYTDGDLYKNSTIDEDGHNVVVFTDKFNRTILKREYLTTTTVAETHYVYDDFGYLVWVLSPEAINQSGGLSYPSTWTITTAILNGLCYRYYYDQRGRLIERQLPGKTKELFVYDNRDRLVTSQDGNLFAKNQWKFITYDCLDRVTTTGVASGEYNTQTAWNNLLTGTPVTNTNDLGYYLTNDLYSIYPTSSAIDANIYTYNYYDDYSNSSLLGFTFNSSYVSELAGSAPYAITPQSSANTRGLLTGTSVQVIDVPASSTINTFNRWLSYINFYDDKARLIQTQSNNDMAGTDVVTNQYDFSGTLVSSVLHDNYPTAISPDPSYPNLLKNTDIVKRYNKQYLFSGKIMGLDQNIDNNGFKTIGSLDFDDMGRVSDKSYGVADNAYSYNIRSWLTGINAGKIANPLTGIAFFAELLSYDQGFIGQLYNGNISGIEWRGYGTNANIRSYGYTYDNLNRLTFAEFNEYIPTSTPWWNHTVNDFTMSNVAYDLNGNLQSMNQMCPATPSPVMMDQLTYVPITNTNQLQGVTDKGVVTTNPDFKDNGSSSDYAYDLNGNLTLDNNKGITSISYSYLNKPEHIAVSAKGTVDYVYDALGNKLQKIVYDQVQNTTTITDYNGDFVYQNSALQYISHEEGRCRPIQTPVSSTEGYLYDYYIKDHLGNVRSVVNAEASSLDAWLYNTGLEVSQASTEGMIWSHLDDVRAVRPASIDTNNTMAAQLIGTNPQQCIGTAIMLRVMPGDQFSVSAQTYYDVVGNNNAVTSNAIASALLSALSGGVNAPGIQQGEIQQNTQVVQGCFSNPAFPGMYTSLTNANYDATKPAAYVNYIVFDDNYNVVTSNSGAMQISGAASTWNSLATPNNVLIGQPGYVAVFSSSGTDQPAYVDNLNVTFYKGNELEEDYYYPFGLTFSSPTTGNNIKYNGKEIQHNEFKNTSGVESGLEWYDYGARMQDPQIGRWMQMDPLAERTYNLTPYRYGFNNPVRFTDPDGLSEEDDFSESNSGINSSFEMDVLSKNGRGKVKDGPANKGQNLMGPGHIGLFGRIVSFLKATEIAIADAAKSTGNAVNNANNSNSKASASKSQEASAASAASITLPISMYVAETEGSEVIGGIAGIFSTAGMAVLGTVAAVLLPENAGQRTYHNEIYWNDPNFKRKFGVLTTGKDIGIDVESLPWEPGASPGPEWTWEGPGTPLNGEGNWSNAKKQKLHQDWDHPLPKLPHWGLKNPDGTRWDIYRDGTIKKHPRSKK